MALSKLCELMRVPYADACPLDFNFLCDQCQQKEELKIRKIAQFLVLLALLVIFTKFFSRLRSDL